MLLLLLLFLPLPLCQARTAHAPAHTTQQAQSSESGEAGQRVPASGHEEDSV
eukprot:CAMPEP_0173193446 /NCGR_PEP_ID=MMETSP1141-20130122/13959_1 /TAXON_ID=483371 /ORGANISM="non described non described, Strain CCMP2298" /LENGTH=51 /DNA_ID=CAMNT_0014117775 /DNA_START=202 /DNA_END=357 /DNA_ORIENTATION=+